MRFGVIEVGSKNLDHINSGEWACGFPEGHQDNFLHFSDHNASNVERLIASWRVAGWYFKKNGRKRMFVSSIPEGTIEEYAPAQKPPPKRPLNKVSV